MTPVQALRAAAVNRRKKIVAAGLQTHRVQGPFELTPNKVRDYFGAYKKMHFEITDGMEWTTHGYYGKLVIK